VKRRQAKDISKRVNIWIIKDIDDDDDDDDDVYLDKLQTGGIKKSILYL
jgi:hypothetical protein